MLFNNPEVIGPSAPDVIGSRTPESKPPMRPPPVPLLLGAVAFWAWVVAVAVAEVKLAVPLLVLLLLGKKVKAAEAFQVGRGAEEDEVLA